MKKSHKSENLPRGKLKLLMHNTLAGLAIHMGLENYIKANNLDKNFSKKILVLSLVDGRNLYLEDSIHGCGYKNESLNNVKIALSKIFMDQAEKIKFDLRIVKKVSLLLGEKGKMLELFELEI